MSYRFLKHMPSGVVYMYQEVFASNPEFQECADATGNAIVVPEPVVDPDIPARRAKLALKMVVDPAVDDAGLAVDASRGLRAKGL